MLELDNVRDHNALGLRDEQVLAMYRSMLLARRLDERMWALNRQGRVPFVVSVAGHEACQVGAAFALNAMIERDRVELLNGEPVLVPTPSASGDGQKFYRCPSCQIALWSHYAMATGDKIAFVRVGTLDEPHSLKPDVHIFTQTKQPWLELGSDIPVFPVYYNRNDVWPTKSLERYNALLD